MKIWKTLLQALLGLLAACAAAAAVGTWILPQENDLLGTVGGIRLSVSGIGAGLSLLTMLAFADGWIGARNRRLPEARGIGRVMNGLGFGLLPGVAVWKVFEQHTALGRGNPLPEGLNLSGFLTREDAWLPSLLELMLALLLFVAVVIWLMLRKADLPENGDLFGVSAVCWGAVRTVTEGFRAAQLSLLGETRVVGWLAAGVVLAGLVVWCARNLRQKRNTGYILACIPVFLVSITGIVLIQNGVIRSGIPAVNLAAQCCFALLAMKAALCLGRISRIG